MKIYYIWDAYCGWCYGFGKVLKQFTNNHPEIEIEVLSGGLFNQGKPVGMYEHISESNKRISEIYGVNFGPNYNDLLSKGTHILDSYHPAIGYSILSKFLRNDQKISLTNDLQKLFFIDGMSLSDIKTYRKLANMYDIEETLFIEELEEKLKINAGYHEDYMKVAEFGARSYPTLILEKDGSYYDLRGNATTAEQIEYYYNKIVNGN